MFDICDCSYLILERAFLLESNTFSSFCDSLYSFVRFFFLFLFRYVKNGPHHSDKPSSSRESIEDDPFIAASRIQSIEGTGREIPVSTMDTNQTVENLDLSQHS